jgi:DNA replication protein DnaD
MAGWIKLHREVSEHWIFSDPWKFRNWVDLVLMANYQRSRINFGNTIVNIDRGQLVCSYDRLASRWNANKMKVRRFLALLQKDGMIQIESIGFATRLTICKYESYQDLRHADDTPTTRTRPRPDTSATPIKEGKERKKNETTEFVYTPPQNPT